MIKIILSLIVLLPAVLRPATADPASWKLFFNPTLSTALNVYSDDWAGDETGSANWTGQLNASAEKQLRPLLNSKTTLKLAFGQTRVQDPETKAWGAPRKSTDLIDFESLLKLTLHRAVDPYAGFRAVSKFADKTDPENLRYFNPAELTESAGASRGILKRERADLSVRAGCAVRQTVDRDRADSATGVRETDIRNDGGAELVADFRAKGKADWINVSSLLKVYKALIRTGAGDAPGGNAWKWADVSWENILTANITKYVMVNLYFLMLYDKEISGSIRLKNTLSAGVTYTFSRP